MKKNVLLATAVFIALTMTACNSGISQESYDAAVKEASVAVENYNQAASALESAEGKLSNQENTIASLESEISSLEAVSNEYAAYRESMSDYEGLAAAEAEARKIEADEIAASKAEAESREAASKAEEESIAAESKAKEESEAAERESREREEAEKNKYETGISYEQLARTPDEYKGQYVKFKGYVLQVLEGDGETDIRLGTKDKYDNVLLCYYDSSIVTSRVLEDDTITIYGKSMGLYTYESTMGGNITVPLIQIDKIDQ